jgi:TonB family protein
MRFWLTIFALSVFLAPAMGQGVNNDLLQKYQRDLQVDRHNSLAHFRIAEIYFLQRNLQSAANEFRSALNGDLNPKWVEVWSHIGLGKIFDLTRQCDRAVNEYRLAVETNDGESGALEEANQYVYGKLMRAFVPHPDVETHPAANVPKLIQQTAPTYSDEARLAGLEGTVLITGLVTKDGTTRDLRVTQPLGLGLDEKAIEAVRQWHYTGVADQDVFLSWGVDFRLPSSPSPWHLIRADFHPQAGTSRPVFLSVKYPPGGGIGPAAIEEAWVLSSVGRFGAVKVSFDIDEQGTPGMFQVERASDEVWEADAINLIGGWRFRPGMKNGIPVPVRSTFEVAWGRRSLSATIQSKLEGSLNGPPPPAASGGCRGMQP